MQAKLKVANSQNGEKILYEVYPFEKKADEVRKPVTTSAESNPTTPSSESQSPKSAKDRAVMTTDRIDSISSIPS